MRPDADPLISVAEAARKLSLNKSTLSRQIRAGAIRSHDGKVRLSEVLADRANNIDLTRTGRREGRLDAVASTAEPAPRADHDDEDEPVIVVDGAVMTYGDARAMKETYLAKLKRLEFETKRGELAPAAAMVAFTERVFGVVRERLLAIPGKLSGDLDPEQVERVTAELYEALEEMSDPRDALDDAEPLEGEDPDDDGGPAAAAPPQPRGLGRAVPVRRTEDLRRSR